MGDCNFPYFYWQVETSSKMWKTYGYELTCELNKAAAKNQKTLRATLDENGDHVLNLEKMTMKCSSLKTENKLRCIINSNKCYLWSYKDFSKEYSYTPRMSYFLEVAFRKQMKNVKFHYKNEFEVNFNFMIQKNLDNGKVYEMSREEIDVSVQQSQMDDLKKVISSYKILDQVVECEEDRIFNILYSEPVCGEDLQSNFQDLSSYLQRIISSVEAIKDTSTPDIPATYYEYLHLDRNCRLYLDNSGAYSATLILTNIDQNINKFNIMQVLYCPAKRKYGVLQHSGRVGSYGKPEISKGFSLRVAKSKFEEMFFEKTGNYWDQRKNFHQVPGKYDLAYIDLFLDHPLLSQSLAPTIKLDQKIQDLLMFSYGKRTLSDLDKELFVDSLAIAYGKFTPKQIFEGSVALNEVIVTLMNKGKGKDLLKSCDKYYMKIPHHYGNKPPRVIMTVESIEEEINMLQRMADPFVFKAAHSKQYLEHPLDKLYKRLKCTLTPLDNTSEEFQVLKRLLELRGPTHQFKLEIKDAFSWSKEDRSFLDKGNNLLLWHGTKNYNLWSIMRSGLQLPSPEDPCTDLMFGRGVYFADVCTKSANYCCPTWGKNEGILFLCEVSLGRQLVKYNAMDVAPSEHFDSVLGVGKMVPAHFAKTALLKSAADVAFGELLTNSSDNFKLLYNEYIVYNSQQVKIHYLLRVKFIRDD